MRKAAPAFLDSPVNERRERVKKSQQQETRIARMGGGRRVRGSGAKPHARGDARWDRYGVLIEAKRTDKGSISIRADVLDKIVREAMANGKVPAVAIELPTTKFASHDWIMLQADCVEWLMGLAEKQIQYDTLTLAGVLDD